MTAIVVNYVLCSIKREFNTCINNNGNKSVRDSDQTLRLTLTKFRTQVFGSKILIEFVGNQNRLKRLKTFKERYV